MRAADLRRRGAACALGLLLVSGGVLASPAPVPAQATPAKPPGLPFQDRHVLVGFKDGAGAAARARALQRVGAQKQRGIGRAVLATVAPGVVPDAVAALRADPAVRYAEPDWVGQLAGTPDDPSFSQQWALSNAGQVVNGVPGTPGEDIGAPAAWDLTTGSRGVVVAVVDTGLDYTHPDLAANVWSNPGGINSCPAGTHGYNALTGTCDPMDDDTAYGGHGTHVAGIIGAVGNNAAGVAGASWNVTVLPVKTVDASGFGTTSALISGLDWLLRAKQAGVDIRVVNDSQTWKGTAYSQALRDQIALLGSNGMLFVSAGGNTQEDNDDPALRRYPCGYVSSTSVCAAATTSTGALASFANRGATTVDLGAPGSGIYSTLRGGGYGSVSGSSMAAAFVSGAAGLLLARQDLTVSALKTALLVGAERTSGVGGLVRTGARLDVCGSMPGCSPPSAPSTATLGTTTVGGLTDTMAADRKRANPVTLGVDGELTKLSAYLAPTGTAGTQRLTGVVYADAAGSPGALVGSTNELLYSSTQPAGWYDLPFAAPLAVAPGGYWIGLASGTTAGVAGFRWSNVAGIRAWNVASYSAGASDPFGTANRDNELMSLYATYSYTPTTTTQPPFAVTPPVTTATGSTYPAPTAGQVVTATSGDWTPPPGSFAYQWSRCSGAGSSCQPIPGATSADYTPTASDVGGTLQVRVTATGSTGSTTSASPPTMVVAPGPPAPSIGVTTVGPNRDRMNANRKRANLISVGTSGHLTGITVYLERTSTSGTQDLFGVLYADVNGAPTALLASTAAITFSSTQQAGWYELPFTSPVAVSVGRYWIGFLSGRSNGVAGYRWSNQPASRAYNADGYSDGASNPFGSVSTDAQLMSVFAGWVP